MAIRKSSLPTKNHILAVSARLLLEQGYRDTTMKQIASMAGVSVSSMQNFFRNKEGLIAELVKLMFSGQFSAAKQFSGISLPTTFTYAVETVIQIVLTERDENLRELYTEAYTTPDTVEYIYRNMAKELKAMFGERFPDYEESDFYEMEIGSAALMRGYMTKPCDVHFPLHRKIERFLTASLRVYRVSEEEIEQVLAFVRDLDINGLADDVMRQLFERLESYFESEFSDICPMARSGTN